jgi:hypothetical protein
MRGGRGHFHELAGRRQRSRFTRLNIRIITAIDWAELPFPSYATLKLLAYFFGRRRLVGTTSDKQSGSGTQRGEQTFQATIL